MAERNQRLKVGAFVASALVSLAGLVILFGGRPTLFSRAVRYAVVYPEAPGIVVGTPVRKSGVRIGRVTAVDLDPETSRVRISVDLDPRFPPRESEEAVITRGILSGDTTLDFVPKVGPDGEPVARASEYTPGTDIPGVPPVSTRTLLSQASDVLPTAQESLVRLSATFARFEKAVPKVERAADEFGDLSKTAREFLPELRQTNRKVQTLIGGADLPDPVAPGGVALVAPAPAAAPPGEAATLRDVVRELNTILRDNRADVAAAVKSVRAAADSVNDVANPQNRAALAASLKNVQSGTDDAVKLIRLAALFLDQTEKTVKLFNDRVAQSERTLENVERATKPFADNSAEIAKNLLATSADLRATLQTLQGTLRGVNQQEGTLGKVLTDPSLYNNLNHAAAELARVLARAEKVATDLEVFADKVARKPELIGIGGAVRPSVGLKESPTAPLPASPFPPRVPTPNVAPVYPPQDPPLTPIAPTPLP